MIYATEVPENSNRARFNNHPARNAASPPPPPPSSSSPSRAVAFFSVFPARVGFDRNNNYDVLLIIQSRARARCVEIQMNRVPPNPPNSPPARFLQPGQAGNKHGRARSRVEGRGNEFLIRWSSPSPGFSDDRAVTYSPLS